MDQTTARFEQLQVVQSDEAALELRPTLSRLEQLKNTVGNAALGAVVAFEVNPITNELPRALVLTGTELATHNPALSAAAYAGATFIVEAGGAIATARLLDTERGRRMTAGVHRLLERFGMDKLVHTNAVIDSGIAMVAGAPAAIAIRHQQHPERTRQQDSRYGMILALGTTAVSAVVGYMGAEGIAHPNPTVIGGAAIVIGAVLGVRHWIGERFARQNKYEYAAYQDAVKDDGPQLRGYQPADYEKALADPGTKFIPIREGRKTRQWPALADIHHNTEYVAEYFENRYGGTTAYCLSLPSRSALKTSPGAEETLVESIVEVTRSGGRIVFDQRTGEDTAEYIQELVRLKYPGATFDLDDFTDPRNNSAAEVAHFQGAISIISDQVEPMLPGVEVVAELRSEYHRQIAAGEINLTQPRKTIIVDPEDLNKPLHANTTQTVFGRIAGIYDSRFAELTSAYPVRGEQKSEELESLLKKPTTLTVAQVEGDDIIAFTYIADVKDCEWLNPDYFQRTYPGELALYFPGIAADRNHEGRTSLGLMRLIGKLAAPTIDKARIVFQCTNISKEYIPRIVALGVKASGKARFDRDIVQTCSYKYLGMRVQMPGQGRKT